MLDVLYALPDAAIAALFGLAMFLAVAALPMLLWRLRPLTSDKDGVDFATRGQSTVIGFLAIVLSFSLVSAQANLHAVETMVSEEASQLNQLDRLLLRYGDPKVAEMRGLLAAYGQSIVGEEWPLLARGDRSGLDSRLSEPFAQLSRAVFSIDPAPGRQIQIYDQILKEMDGLSEIARPADRGGGHSPPRHLLGNHLRASRVARRARDHDRAELLARDRDGRTGDGGRAAAVARLHLRSALQGTDLDRPRRDRQSARHDEEPDVLTRLASGGSRRGAPARDR